MFCSNCGVENNENNRFCVKCGCRLNASADVKENKIKRKKTERNKSGNIYMILTGLTLVVSIVVVSVFNLWPWSTNHNIAKDGANGKNDVGSVIGTEANASMGDEALSIDNFSFESMLQECPDCRAALETYIHLTTIASDWTTSQEELMALSDQLCSQMQHPCKAQTVYVTDMPYSYRESFGYYTGYWMGAGPSGKGSFQGDAYGDIVSYDGEWKFGVPNGEGELYVENGYLAGWDSTYVGEFKNGMRDGVGIWFEYYADSAKVIDPKPYYRIYDKAVYANDTLAGWVDCADYDAATGDVLGYCKMTTDATGAPIMGETWGPDELSPELQNQVDTILVTAGVTYMTVSLGKELIDSFTTTPEELAASNQRVMAETDRLRALDEQHRQEQEEYLKNDSEARKKDYANRMLDLFEAGEIDAYDTDINSWESIVYQ